MEMEPGSGEPEIMLKLAEIRDIVTSIKAELSGVVRGLAALAERQARLEQRLLQDGGAPGPTARGSAGVSSPPWPRWRLVRLRPATQPSSALWVQGAAGPSPLAGGGLGPLCAQSLVHSQQGVGGGASVGGSPSSPRRLGPCVAEYIAWTGSDARPFPPPPPHACDRCAADEADGGGPAEEAAGASPCSSSRSSLDASVLTPVAFAGTAAEGAHTPPMRKWSLPSLLGGVEMEDGRGGVGGRHTAWRRSLQVHPRAEAPWHGPPRSSSSSGGLPRPSGRAAAATPAHARPERRRHGAAAAAAPASSGDAKTKRSQAAGQRVRRGKDREGPGTPAAPAAPTEGPARKGSLRESLRSFFSRGSRFPNATATELHGERK